MSTLVNDPAANLPTVSFSDALSERYLAYALSTIMSRSLPDARDGLKPVHRRLLYAMHQLKLDPKSGFKKCARVVGDVIGKYHPHGDVAVYEAMVRLAQSFAVRYPLVEGQGNFGSIDGDNPAAMRYTEARLTPVAVALMDAIDQDTVDFRATYDGSEEEPVVMPAAFPNLLANGSEGIAVGMATSIPPHNAGELLRAAQALLAKPETTVADLLTHVQGPDFPTGGVIVQPAADIQAAYETGRGAFRVRARWEVEKLSHGLYQIVVTQIPYQVPKSRLIEKTAELLRDRKLPLLGNLRDESAEDLRVIFEPKNRTVPPEVLMESIFRATELENRFNMNLNVLLPQRDATTGAITLVPQVCDLKTVLQAFLDHRMEVLERRSRHRLEHIARRLEILDGLLIVYLNLDEVIRIIREEDDAKAALIARFSLSDTQAEAILNTRLRSLRKLEEMTLRGEHADLTAEQASLQALLADEGKRRKALHKELEQAWKQFGQDAPGGARRTDISGAPAPVDLSPEAFIEKEPVTVLLSEKGWIRAVKGHLSAEEIAAVKYKEGDAPRCNLHAKTTDKLLLFSTNGRFFTVTADRVPKGKGFGEPVRLMVDLDTNAEILDLRVLTPGEKLLVASTTGRGFVVLSEDVEAQTKAGRQVLTLPAGVRAAGLWPVRGDSVAIIGENRRLLVFASAEIPEMKRGQGVTLQKYKGGGLADIAFFNAADGLSWQSGTRTRTEMDLRLWVGKRGQSGRLPPVGFPKANRFTCSPPDRIGIRP